MNRSGTFVLCLIVPLAAACADANRAEHRADNPGVGTVETPQPSVDHRFIADMLEDGKAEVQLGTLAQQRSRNPAVRDFGAMMVRDHTKAGEELKAFAPRSAETAVHATDADHQRLHDKLSELSGDAFDREYIDAMVKEHEEAVREVEGKSESSSNDQVKQWAAKTLPAVRHHLERAHEIRKSLGN